MPSVIRRSTGEPERSTDVRVVHLRTRAHFAEAFDELLRALPGRVVEALRARWGGEWSDPDGIPAGA